MAFDWLFSQWHKRWNMPQACLYIDCTLIWIQLSLHELMLPLWLKTHYLVTLGDSWIYYKCNFFLSIKIGTKEHPLHIDHWINRNWLKWIRILSMFSVLDIGLLKRFEISIGQRNSFSINPIGGIHYWNAFELHKANWIILYDLFHH